MHSNDRSAIRFLQSNKLPLVLASGRTFDHMMYALQRNRIKLTPRDYLIAQNGGLVYQCNAKRPIKELVFTKSLVSELILASEKYKLSLFGYGRLGSSVVVRNARWFSLPVFAWKLVRGMNKRLVCYNSSCPVPVAKITIVGQKNNVEQFIKNFLSKQKLAFYPLVRFCYGVIDIAPFAASKQQAINEICNLISVSPQHVMFVGNGHNDISALKWSGLGIAMGNAPNPVKTVAKEITASVEHAGFAQAVARHFRGFAGQVTEISAK